MHQQTAIRIARQVQSVARRLGQGLTDGLARGASAILAPLSSLTVPAPVLIPVRVESQAQLRAARARMRARNHRG